MESVTSMQWMWCWRCKAEMPMLDEDEFAIISPLYSTAIEGTKRFREEFRTTLAETPIEEIFQPVREAYARLTGMENCHHDAIRHHRIRLYGPPCQFCHKPLRTPKATLCGSCMESVLHEGS